MTAASCLLVIKIYENHSVCVNPPKKGGSLVSSLTINKQALSIYTELTILGVKSSFVLTCSAHAHHILSKITSKISVIRHFGRSLKVKSRVIAYNAFVKPHLLYYLLV